MPPALRMATPGCHPATRLMCSFDRPCSDAEKRRLDDAVAKFWNEAGLPWSYLDDPLFYEFMLAIRPDYAAKGLIKSNDPRGLPGTVGG